MSITFFAASDYHFYLVVIVKLLLSCILGGLIGYERSHMPRPAGFRTHILVCVGAALVMLTSEDIYQRYKGLTNLDPARLGAQVISGIGFLGAGTIIREGATVKGLTTAASLWTVSCVGIAVGAGFYEGAIISTIMIYTTLQFFKKLETKFVKMTQLNKFCIEANNMFSIMEELYEVLNCHKVKIESIKFIMENENEENKLLRVVAKFPKNIDRNLIFRKLQDINGVVKVYSE